MKLLHTSDWHLGRLNSNKPIDEDQKFFIDKIVEIVKAQGVDAVLLAGDIYDRSVASPDAIRLNDYAMTRLVKECGAAVLAVAGNHDGATRLEANSELLKETGLYISGVLEREIMSFENEEVQIFLLPWITPDKVKSVFPECEKEITDTHSAYQAVCDKIRESFAENKRHILVCHAFITASETSTSDRSAEIGTAAQVEARVFDGFDYVALGHIHKPQSITDKIRYSGTPMPYAFGKEEKQEKSVTLIDTDDMSIEIAPLPLLHKRATLTGTYDELSQCNYPEDIVNGFVRLELTDAFATLEAMSFFKELYPNVLEFQGKSFDNEEATITLSVEELEEMENNPLELFKQFYRERVQRDIDEHTIDLFNRALEQYEEGE